MFVHTIDPVLLDLGFVQVRYYGVIYLLGFVIAYFMLNYLAKERHIKLSKNDISDYLVYLAVGTLIGARIFYAVVYNPEYFATRLWEVFYIWQGGLSFHGGLLGAGIAVYLFCKKHNVRLLQMADITVLPLSLAIAFGRIGNFINAELVGRITNVSWCVEFPDTQGCRHLSQLYASLKNFIIFSTLFALRNATFAGKKLRNGTLISLFLVLYGLFRFVVGNFRAPDAQVGYLLLGLTMGQWLSIITFFGGCVALYLLYYSPYKEQLQKL